jgi:hypothetical protein
MGCKKECSCVETAVCGSFSVNYPSLCDLENAACDDPQIKFVSVAPCGKNHFVSRCKLPWMLLNVITVNCYHVLNYVVYWIHKDQKRHSPFSKLAQVLQQIKQILCVLPSLSFKTEEPRFA